MSEEIEIDKTGLTLRIGWLLVVKWFWKLVVPVALAVHMWFTHNSFAKVQAAQTQQRGHMDKLEEVIQDCLTKK